MSQIKERLTMWKYFKSIALGTSALVFMFSNCATRKVTCPDGQYLQYRRPDKVYAPYVKAYDDAIKATFKILDSVELTAGVDLKEEVVVMREKLTSNDALIQDMIKGNFMTFNMCICDPEARKNYYQFQKYMVKTVSQINAANHQLQTISDLKTTTNQELLLSVLEQTINQTNAVIADSPVISTDSTKRHLSVYINCENSSIKSGDLIIAGMMNALDTNKQVEFEYYSDRIDRRKADFEIIVDVVSVDIYGDENGCEYTYTFTLRKIESLTDARGRGAETVTTKYCNIAKREQDVGDQFKTVSFSMVQKMLK